MNFFSELPKAGLTPDENGEYKLGLSEMALVDDYQRRKMEQEQFMNQNNTNRWGYDYE